MLDFTWAIVGGLVMVAIMGAVLWLVCLGLVELLDWAWGAIEAALKKAAAAGVEQAKIAAARKLLFRAAGEVLAGESDSYAACDPYGADRARREILEAIVSLTPKGRVTDGNKLVPGYRPVKLKQSGA